MLVLSRKSGESLVIPESNVIVTVVRISRGRVKLGVTAPACVAVHRQELLVQTSTSNLEVHGSSRR